MPGKPGQLTDPAIFSSCATTWRSGLPFFTGPTPVSIEDLAQESLLPGSFLWLLLSPGWVRYHIVLPQPWAGFVLVYSTCLSLTHPALHHSHRMGSQESQVLVAGHSLPGFPQRMVVTGLETILLAPTQLTPHKEAHISSSTPVTCFLQLKLII